jgi:hypothetical protein
MPSDRPALPLPGLLCVGFFVVSGLLELGLGLAEPTGPEAVWNGAGQALLHWLLAAGLWRRLTVCRVLALVYCLATLVTYGAVLALALAREPLRFPPSVVVLSLFQVPSAAVLLPWLRSAAAVRAFPRRLRR